jgi:hypothetical protein
MTPDARLPTMTANSNEAAEPCNGSAATDEDGQTRREHLQMWGAGLGLAALPTATASGDGQVHDHDIWLYDDTLEVEPFLRLRTGPVSIEIPSRSFESADLEVRGWGEENEVLLDVDANHKDGSVKPSFTLDREEARELAKRLLETTQWLEKYNEDGA